jgi:hypothetical protein
MKIIRTAFTDVKRPEVSEERANFLALRVIGSCFTEQFLKKTHGPRNFSVSAESCLEKVQEWNRAKIWTSVLVTISILFFALTVFLGYPNSTGIFNIQLYLVPLSLGSIFALIAIYYSVPRLTIYKRPNETAKMVANAWKPMRKRAISTKLVELFARNILHWYYTSPDVAGEVDIRQYDGRHLRAILKEQLSSMASEVARYFRGAKQHEAEEAAARYRDRFGAIDEVNQALGFGRINWGLLNPQQ